MILITKINVVGEFVWNHLYKWIQLYVYDVRNQELNLKSMKLTLISIF